jgi:hypothetical protein
MHRPLHVRHQSFDHAIELLREGRTGESGYGRRVALLLTIPTFDDPVARDIRRSVTGGLYVVRTVWQRALDTSFARPTRSFQLGNRSLNVGLELMSNRRPTLVSSKVDVDVDALDSLLATLASTTVACHVEQPDPSLDATIFELTLGCELTETRYRWTADAPAGWEPLGLFSSLLMRLVDTPAAAGTR